MSWRRVGPELSAGSSLHRLHVCCVSDRKTSMWCFAEMNQVSEAGGSAVCLPPGLKHWSPHRLLPVRCLYTAQDIRTNTWVCAEPHDYSDPATGGVRARVRGGVVVL